MRHEKIFKREDGTKVNISIEFWNESCSNKYTYKVSVSVCEPKKRTFSDVNDTDNYTWRRLSLEERNKYEMGINLRYVTKEEIQETASELWQKMKPKIF